MVLTGGTLIDGTGAPPLADAAVVVRGDRIIVVGRAGAVEIPPFVSVIDVTGDPVLDIRDMADVRLVMGSGVVIPNHGFD